MVAIVIPAHNEQSVIGRLLDALTETPLDGPAEIVVVANGCTDDTAAVAGAYPGVTVVETPVPSKTRALALGDQHVSSFPRLYVDADVVLRAQDVRALCSGLRDQDLRAAGPTRMLPMEEVSWPVRWYYDVWQRFRGVREELFGRGVVAVDEAGHGRISDWPEAMSDDLVMAMSFGPSERAVIPDAHVLIWPPKTYADLLRRRVRAMTGNRQLELAAPPAVTRRSTSTPGELARIVLPRPWLAPAAAVFAGTAVLTKVRGRAAARRGDTTWLRDESSRTG